MLPHGEKDVNPRKRFSDYVDISALDNVYVTSKEKPSKAAIKTTTKALNLGERRKVS